MRSKIVSHKLDPTTQTSTHHDRLTWPSIVKNMIVTSFDAFTAPHRMIFTMGALDRRCIYHLCRSHPHHQQNQYHYHRQRQRHCPHQQCHLHLGLQASVSNDDDGHAAAAAAAAAAAPPPPPLHPVTVWDGVFSSQDCNILHEWATLHESERVSKTGISSDDDYDDDCYDDYNDDERGGTSGSIISDIFVYRNTDFDDNGDDDDEGHHDDLTPLERALNSVLVELGTEEDGTIVEYWTRQEYLDLETHADLDEDELAEDGILRFPTFGHVLYLKKESSLSSSSPTTSPRQTYNRTTTTRRRRRRKRRQGPCWTDMRLP
jgi:hypothetical protein